MKAILLHFGGSDLQDLFETLSVSDPAENETVYSKAVQALDTHLLPKTNVPYERHVFRQMHQEENETIDQFVAKLRRQADLCEFGTDMDNQIRDQVVDKCKSQHLRKKLLEKGTTLTLEIAIEKARSEEVVDKQLKEMESRSMTTAAGQSGEINQVKMKRISKPFSGQS